MKPVNRMFGDLQIQFLEEKYKAKYVIDTCLRTVKEGWANFPAAIFYTEETHPQGSNYFAMFKDPTTDDWMISNGYEAVQGVFHGILFEDGELVHSRFRHDYFVHREAMADGARDYFRTSTCPEGAKHIKFEVMNGELKRVIDFEYDTGRIIE